MTCEYVGKCGGCTCETLDYKLNYASKILNIKSFEIFTSKLSGFRSRCELSVFHKNGVISLAMRAGAGESKIERKRFVEINTCINLVKPLRESLECFISQINLEAFCDFRDGLFSIEALYTNSDSLLLTLIYHKNIDEKWLIEAKKLKDFLCEVLNYEINIIGRSRGVKLILDSDIVLERLKIFGREYVYYYKDTGFTQPNTEINKQMIEWVLKNVESRGDLLELYCGSGNFTLPLSSKFKNIFATEISKSSIKSAINAALHNKINNINFVRLSGDECIEALNKVREFNRLKHVNLDSYNFSSVFVDPPRAGLGEKMSRFISRFREIIYISCNVESLRDDLKTLKETHEIFRCAFFDQFPHTRHLECGVILKRKTS